MAVRIVRLGSPRTKGEGLRIGTVRRPPRGVPREHYASEDYYDVWLPNLAPSAALLREGRRISGPEDFAAFARKYRSEMMRPDNLRIIDVLAALSRQTNFSVGCYCENEARCHRSILAEILRERGAAVAPGDP